MTKQTGTHKKNTITLTQIINNTKSKKNYPETGTITMFIGTVRQKTKDQTTQKLQIQAYEPKTTQVLRSICNDLKKKPGITDVQIHHLIGEFKPGEELVYVLVAGSHRNKVFPTLKQAVNRYKREAPIFKKEFTINKKGKTKAYWVNEHHGA